MVQVKSREQIRNAYAESINAVPAKYKAGVEQSKGWKENAIKGQAVYEQRMSDPAVLKRREAGLQSTNEEEWRRNASTNGAARIAAGMQASAGKREANYEPYRATLEALNLPERTADPMQNVQNRVGGVVQAMVDTKRNRTR